MGDPLTLEEKLKDPEYINGVKAVLILRELKIGISSFVEVRCREVQEAIRQTVLKNLPPHTKVLVCTECTRATLNSKKPCPEKICPFILEEIKKIHKSKRIELSCTDVSAWTNTSGYWEIARTFMGKEQEDKKSTEAADTDCTGLLSIIINCMPIHKYLTMDMERNDTVFHQVKDIRNDVMHSPDNLLSNAFLKHLIKACVQILDEPKILAVAAKERIKEIERMLLTVSNVDYTSVFLEVQENQRREISEMKTNVAVIALKQASQDKKQAAQDKNISDLKQAAQDKKQSAQDTNISDLAGKQASPDKNISDLARQQALQGYELQAKRTDDRNPGNGALGPPGPDNSMDDRLLDAFEFDILILHTDNDNSDAYSFGSHLMKECRADKLKVITWAGYCPGKSMLRGMEDVFSKARYIFVYVTDNLTKDDFVRLIQEASIIDSFTDPVKKWRIVPVQTTQMKINIFELNSLCGLNYSCWMHGTHTLKQSYLTTLQQLIRRGRKDIQIPKPSLPSGNRMVSGGSDDAYFSD